MKAFCSRIMAIGRRGFKTTIGQVWLPLTDHNARPDVFLLFSRIVVNYLSFFNVVTKSIFSFFKFLDCILYNLVSLA